jgi:hypothetical protein
MQSASVCGLPRLSQADTRMATSPSPRSEFSSTWLATRGSTFSEWQAARLFQDADDRRCLETTVAQSCAPPFVSIHTLLELGAQYTFGYTALYPNKGHDSGIRASNLGAKSTDTMPSSLSIPVAIPPPPAQLALVALQVASILTSDAVTSATARIASSLVGPNCVGHERPTTAFFQSIGDKQTYIGVPGADDLLVADAKFIADHVARATSLDSPFHDDLRHPRPDLVDAVKFECAFAHDPDAFHADRLRRLAMWESLAASLSTAHKALQPLMSPQALYLLKAGASYPLIEAARSPLAGPMSSWFHSDAWVSRQWVITLILASSAPLNARPPVHIPPSLPPPIIATWCVFFATSGAPEQHKALRIVTSKTHDEVAAGLCFGGFLS